MEEQCIAPQKSTDTDPKQMNTNFLGMSASFFGIINDYDNIECLQCYLHCIMFSVFIIYSSKR